MKKFKHTASLIAETPTLYGKYASKFLRDVEKNQQKVSKEEMEKIRKSYEKLKAIQQFE